MKKRISALACACLLFAFANTASAHIIVTPKQSVAGTFEQYRLLVAAEKDPNFTKLRLEFPSRVKLLLVGPVAGWNYEYEKDADGNVKALVWTATAGGVKKGEFAEFSFVGMNSKEATTVAWKALETYADGSTDEWSGENGSDKPAAFVTIIAPTTAVDHHGNPINPGEVDKGHEEGETAPHDGTESATAKAATPATESTSSSTTDKLPLFLSAAALLAALSSLVLLLRKRA